MNRMIKELSITMAREIKAIHFELKRLDDEDLKISKRKPSASMSIVNLLQGKKDVDLKATDHASIRVRSDALEENIKSLEHEFKERAAVMILKDHQEFEEIKELQGKIDYFKSIIFDLDTLKDDTNNLKNDVRSFIEFPKTGGSYVNFYKDGAALSDRIVEAKAGFALDQSPSIEMLKDYLIDSSRRVGGAVYKMNQKVTIYEERKEKLQLKLDTLLDEAVSDLKNRSKFTISMYVDSLSPA